MVSVILKAIGIFFLYGMLGAMMATYGDKKTLEPVGILIMLIGMFHSIIYITNNIYKRYVFPREVESLLAKIEGLNNKVFILERENIELREKNNRLMNNQNGVLKLKTNFERCRLQMTLLKEENERLKTENRKQEEKYRILVERINQRKAGK